ncbi:MAG: hypothetical protein OEY15_12860 [Myxococcales bacterium]|nr:hypothetical protein [Myxococcales bacterium]
MKLVFALLVAFAALVWWMLHAAPRYTDTVIAEWTVDDMSGMTRDVARVGALIDRDISHDGNGSLRIEFRQPGLVNLYEVWGNEEDLSFRQLLYEAQLRTEQASGPVFLVMQAGVSGAPEGGMPVIGLERAISGSTDWTPVQIWAGNPGNAKHFGSTLQIESRGTGSVWIDSVRLVSRQIH